MRSKQRSDLEFLSDSYKKWAQPVYNKVCMLIGNSQDAEDIMQESFIEAFEQLNSLKDESKFLPWIHKIARNKALNIISRDKNRYLISFDQKSDLPDEEENSVHWDDLSSLEITNAIEELPDGFKMVTKLYLFENLSHEEIAKILDIRPSTSRSQYSRARTLLRKLLINSKQHG